VKLGFVGLGAMGELIVPRLMEAGHQVTGWNRSREKGEPLVAQGMKWADSPRAVAEQSEIVFSIVTDGAAVKAVALGPDGIVSGLAKGGIYIDMSTIEPEVSRAVAAEFGKAGSIMLDGPLSGSPVTVKAGQASVMIGGDEAAFERARPVLLAIGPKVTRIGGNGLGNLMFTWARCLAAAERHGWRMVWPTWPSFKPKNWRVNPYDHRTYSDLFAPTARYVTGWRKPWCLARHRWISEQQAAAEGAPPGSVVQFRGMQDKFAPFREDHELVYGELLRIARPRHLAAFAEPDPAPIGIHEQVIMPPHEWCFADTSQRIF